MTHTPLILDTDGGVDDAQALILLLSHGVVPQAITTVFGNVSLDVATRNVLDVLSLARAKVPVYRGQARPLVAPIIDAAHIHGEDGLGQVVRPEYAAVAEEGGAADYLVRQLRGAVAAGTKINLLMIGPLTNLAMALRMAPETATGIGHLWIMGGTLFGRGNTTPAAEFNIYADPEAAQIVFAADIPTTVAAWEVCVDHFMTKEAVDALISTLPDTALAHFNAHLLHHARQTNLSYGGSGDFQFVDPLAAMALIDPDVVTKSLTASVDVALAPGIARGMTIVDPTGALGAPPVSFIEQADRARLCAMFEASVRWGPQGD